ncbi:alpha-1,2-fucosyltransferase [Luteolibacter flavescens]|uniref:Alpha-1,2-fucosyltransferase n=1 Tax=Luteolibacter flavescens TaxID=1859460 RepID=A0ABT3FHY3_9BACT|nr:alpha-1,2-fucosyltransferase [Luteolibacter flavescens]MCW1883178.1 alpha-1,2-fucosyltransferase [Luteolibacter flavescens]
MTRAVVAMIKGGLGNQLFAYAAARAYAIRTRRELWIDDVSGYQRDGYNRAYKLDQFPIAATLASPRWRFGDPKGVHHKSMRSMNKVLPQVLKSYLAEDTDLTETQLTGFISNRLVVRLNGYWQSEKYFFERASTIRKELEPPAFPDGPDADMEARLASTNSIFLHIRRDRYSPRLGSGYYDSSIEAAMSTLGSCEFHVFGDDLDWARQYIDFQGAPVTFVTSESSDELRDFRLMAACRHAIIANSSFSWWAAYLRRHADKRVWTPNDPGWPLKPASEWTKVPNRLEH